MNEKMVEASYGKRVLSHLLDVVFALVVGLVLFFTLTSTFFLQAIGGYAYFDAAASFLEDTGLYTISRGSTGEATSYRLKTYEDGETKAYASYLDATRKFYTVFLPSDSRVDAVSKDGVSVPASEYYTDHYFNVTVMGFNEPASVDVTSESSRAGTNKYFMYALNDAKTAVDEAALPLLQSSYQAKVDENDADAITALTTYFYYADTSYSGLYPEAATLANEESYFTSKVKTYTLKYYSSFVLAMGPTLLIFFFVIPLCTGDDRTLGKLICKLAVVDKDGYRLKGSRIIWHPLLVTVETLLVLIYPTYLGFMAFALLSIIDYIFLVASKKRLSLHDSISRTRVADAKSSQIFASEADKEAYIVSHPDVVKGFLDGLEETKKDETEPEKKAQDPK